MWTSPGSWRSLYRISSFVLCVVVVGYATACHQTTAQDLVGTWELNYAESKLKLQLNPDGTFEQVLQPKGNPALHRSGKWELTDFEGPTVVLNGAFVVRDEKGTLESANDNGAWLVHVENGFGAPRLTVNEDLGLYFAKTSR